jgi:hypothetical protein
LKAEFAFQATRYQYFFARLKKYWEERTPTDILLASHFARSCCLSQTRLGGLASDYRNFERYSLASFQAKKYSGTWGRRRQKIAKKIPAFGKNKFPFAGKSSI